MKNWEDFKELSYVNIKLTKAKSISQGLTRCKIDKLSRKNPVYQHLQLHKIHKRSSPCPLCMPSPHQHSPLPSPHLTTPKKKLSESTPPKVYSQRLNKNMSLTPREKKRIQNQKVKTQAECLADSLKRTRSHFNFMTKKKSEAQDYFVTAVDDIDFQIYQDRCLSIRLVKTEDQMLKQEIWDVGKRRKEMQAKIKKLTQPVIFPFSTEQMGHIVSENQKVTFNSRKKIDKMVTSLYEYKSSRNYSKRMQKINSILEK